MLTLNYFRVNRQIAYHGDIGLVERSPDHGDIGLAPSPLHIIHAGYLFHFLYDILVMGRHQLPAIIPIGFIAIVFLWIMRGGTDHATLAMQVTDSKAQFRGGPERL